MNEIKQKDYDGIGISFRNNPLGLPVQEAKEAFDELPIWIIGKLNELIQEYNGYTGDIQGVRIGSNGQLEYTVDGSVWYELVSANLKSGSAAGSVRGVNAMAEGDTYTMGENAFAQGYQTQASGQYSHAQGYQTKASEVTAHAEGNATTASGNAAHAEGMNSIASANAAHAEGQSTQASGQSAHAQGQSTTASGYAAHAQGYDTEASGQAAHAQGSATVASGSSSHAQGNSSHAEGDYSHAQGNATQAIGMSSHAEGEYTIAQGGAQHVQGKYNVADSAGTYAHIVGNGEYNARSNAHTLDWSGNAWFAGNVKVGGTSAGDEDAQTLITNMVNGSATGSVRGVNTQEENESYTLGAYAVAQGYGTQASGQGAHAEGISTSATGGSGHAEGYVTQASGGSAHAQGGMTKASGAYSHAQGFSTTASKEASHAQGYLTQAQGDYSHAEGESTTASGQAAHAQGANTIASGAAAHAEGNFSTASGQDSHAEGRGSEASGNSSHAEGAYTIASSKAQHVQGEYNIEDTAGTDSTRGTYAHIVGNGTSNTARSNAHTLDWAGNAWFAGDVKVGGASAADGEVLATQAWVLGNAPGGGGSGSGYVYTQQTAAQNWSIIHNLNKMPSVTIVDSSGNIVIGEVQYRSQSEIELEFASAFSGKAYLN